jgi:hypothetical protein
MLDDPIHRCLDRWHEFLRSRDHAILDDLLADDVVFVSPVVFTPQKGKDVTKLYLTAAGNSLGGKSDGASPVVTADADAEGEGDGWDGSFRYVRKIREGHHAVLEFETTVGGKYVNGVDLITCDDDAHITEFKVMIRPLQAVNAVHEQMRAMLERLSN